MAISQPKSTTFTHGGVSGKLTWASNFAARRNQQIAAAQKYVDSEVLRLCSPRVPFDTGMLEKSGKLGTVIGSGEVKYTAPYAAYQYYETSETRDYDADRGAKWFERMKVANLKDIEDGVNKFENL